MFCGSARLGRKCFFKAGVAPLRAIALILSCHFIPYAAKISLIAKVHSVALNSNRLF
jgi:hypothetical protein